MIGREHFPIQYLFWIYRWTQRSAPELRVNFQRFGALASFPSPLPPSIRWGLIGTLLVVAPGALIEAEHFPIQYLYLI